MRLSKKMSRVAAAGATALAVGGVGAQQINSAASIDVRFLSGTPTYAYNPNGDFYDPSFDVLPAGTSSVTGYMQSGSYSYSGTAVAYPVDENPFSVFGTKVENISLYNDMGTASVAGGTSDYRHLTVFTSALAGSASGGIDSISLAAAQISAGYQVESIPGGLNSTSTGHTNGVFVAGGNTLVLQLDFSGYLASTCTPESQSLGNCSFRISNLFDAAAFDVETGDFVRGISIDGQSIDADNVSVGSFVDTNTSVFYDGQNLSQIDPNHMRQVTFSFSASKDSIIQYTVLSEVFAATTSAANGIGGNIDLRTLPAVPEPGTFGLLGAGLLGLGAFARRRQHDGLAQNQG